MTIPSSPAMIGNLIGRQIASIILVLLAHVLSVGIYKTSKSPTLATKTACNSLESAKAIRLVVKPSSINNCSTVLIW